MEKSKTPHYAFPEMDFETEIVYYRNGTPEADGVGPIAFQGLTLVEYRRFKNSKNWAFIGYGLDGKPSLGYLPEELSQAAYEMWAARIKGAAENPRTGYQDSNGLWFPGNLPKSVISATAHAAKQELLERSFYNQVAPTIIEEEMVQTEKAVRLAAFKESFGAGAARKMGQAAQVDTASLGNFGRLSDKSVALADKKRHFHEMLSTLRAMRGAGE